MELHRRAFAGHAKDFGYYQIAAETLADQFQHRYLVLQNQRTGQAALKPVFLADQDILEGLPRQFSSVLAAPRQIRPRWLKLQMLVAGGSLYHFNTGFDYTVSLDLYARHTSPMLNPIFRRALEYLQPVRHHPILRDFSNYNELSA